MNQITKRVCVLGTFGVIVSWIALILYVVLGSSWIFCVIYLLIMIHQYIILCCTYNDAHIKLCSFCYYPPFCGNDLSKDQLQLSKVMESNKTSTQNSNVQLEIH
eukprot:UN02934